MMDYNTESPVYRLSLGDELVAEMYDAEANLELQTRRKKALYNNELDLPMDPETEDNQRFFDTIFADNDRSQKRLKSPG